VKEIALPPWWGRRQRYKNNVLFLLIRAGIVLARILPLWMLSLLGEILASIGFLFAVKDRRRAITQIKTAMPELTHPAWTIFGMFRHLGRLGGEWVHIEKLTKPGSRYLRFSPETQGVVKDALAEGHGVLCVTPHLGNWELLAQAATRHGLPCTTIAKPLYDPRLTALVSEFRGRSGLVTLWRGDVSMREHLENTLAKAGLLGVLIDQDTKVAHVFAPFFGRLAATPVVPQRLAVQHRSAVVFGHATREGGKYTMHFERVPWTKTGDDEADALALTVRLNALTEDAIKKHPEQWMWMHRRWKTQPKI
jgi:Kdo2-lipid IVA lauroyltransferase/acyltransferase